MFINEILTEDVLDEYITIDSYNTRNDIRDGNLLKGSARLVNTPLTQFNVRYLKSSDKDHDYFFYDKQTDKCVGVFRLQEWPEQIKKFNKLLGPGIRAVTPHMSLAPAARRQGISTLAYTTFLRGGPWVFVTSHHSDAAANLWKSLAQGDVISFYTDFDYTGKIYDTPKRIGYRFLGPRDRFTLP
jgi:hypothetical protein